VGLKEVDSLKDKVDSYVALAENICQATKAFIDEGTSTLRRQHYVLQTRDKVLFGLGLKIDSAFRALIDDARLRRVETVHHLKTIVEALMYLLVVQKDPTDTSARRVLYEICNQKEQYYATNPERDPIKRHRKALKKRQAQFVKEGITPMSDIFGAASAHSASLKKWYNAAYRFACENAHIADLFVFMPDVEADELDIGPFRAQRALDYGIQAMLTMVELANANVLGLRLDKARFERRLTEIRAEAHK
jgi:hypothetical protein